MSRLLLLLALAILPARALAQDSDQDTETADTGAFGAVGASGEEGGGPACACSPGVAAFPSAPLLGLAALVARRRRDQGVSRS